jgi:membrane-associated HD superfamily phosphohydrolase
LMRVSQLVSLVLKMSMNKFGAPRENNDSKNTRVQQQQQEQQLQNEHTENYVRENALCLNATKEFDAKLRRIIHVAEPEEGGDVATKQFVEEHVRYVKGNLSDEYANKRYVRDNTLYLTNNGYDARGLTIRHVPWPKSFNDVAHKNYVDETLKAFGEKVFNSIQTQIDLVKFSIQQNDENIKRLLDFTKQNIDYDITTLKKRIDELDKNTLRRINGLHGNIDVLLDKIYKVEGGKRKN